MNPQQKQSKVNSSCVKVIIRVRPLVASQKQSQQIVKINADQKSLKIYHDSNNSIQSNFDHILTPTQSQSDVFQQFHPYIAKIFQGYNLTIFAYGQTGSGKTYTMFGNDWQNIMEKNQAKKQITFINDMEADQNFAGVIPRAVYNVFQQKHTKTIRFNVYCSFLQIYNEKIYDLLQDSPNPKPLNIHQSKLNGIFVQGLTEFQVQHFSDWLNLMKQGQKNRFIRQTTMNAKSSRSHTIFQILVQSVQSDKNGNYIKARLNLCDLAGSQKINKKQVMVNEHMLELKNINLSLTTLGKVINSLSSPNKKSSIAAFRESKLTRLLQQSLTVNTNTFIIGNISPSSKNTQQTLNTLKFVERASHITMKIKPLDFNQQNVDSVTKLKKEIQYLKELLSLKKQGSNEENLNHQLQNLQNRMSPKGKNQNLSPKQFEKLLIQNRKMKKEIYQLQNNLQRVRSDVNSNMTHRSQLSNASNISSQYTAHQDLRKQIYIQKFLKNKSPKSPLILAGQSTISNQLTQQQRLRNKKEKQDILVRMEKIEQSKRQADSLILEQLESFRNQDKSDRYFVKDDAQGKRYQPNVIRRGKASLDKQLDKTKQIDQLNKKKKVDYGDKIKELQARLYKK